MADVADNKWQFWHDELEQAADAKGFKTWQTRAKKIVKRYRDERGDATGDTGSDSLGGSRFNILWSNVQTLMPALFAKSPKPVVERRYLDKDDVGRTASVILERALLYELDSGGYVSAVRKCVLDRLLPGRGVAWVRYEPKFTPMPGKTQDNAAEETAEPAKAEGDEQIASPAESTPEDEQVASESVPIDYVDWQDFQTSPARTWEEVWWISKRVYMTREELVKRFGAVGKEIPLDWSPNQTDKQSPGVQPPQSGDMGKSRARIVEIWDRTKRKVIWIAEKWNEKILDEKDDPLQLEGFWPVPKPLFATLTNDSLIPVPDFYEYQDQANELDDLTNRITNLTKCIKNAGIYDASIDELKRMFEEGFENQLVPADNMAEFMSKAGSSGMGHIWLLPIKDMAEVLIQLYSAREQVKQSLYEITGISDIVRGAASQGGAKTATEQRIKGQFASMRLNDMQAEVARFCRDILRIQGEIIAEHFDPKTLFLISGFEQYAKEQWPPEPPQQPPMMGHNGGPPMQSPMPVAPPGMGAASPVQPPQPGAGPQPIDPVMAAQAKAQDMFTKAIELLRNDKLRGFRIDIETDSIVEPDQKEMQQARTELMGAISEFLPRAIAAGEQAPELRPLLARLLMFFLRGFKASRDIEAAFEQFIDDMQKQAANPQPKPPSPEQMKAQAEQQKQQAESQRMAAQFQMDQQRGQMEMQMLREKNDMEMQKMQAELEIKKQELALDQQRMAMEERAMQAKAALDERTAAIQAQATEHKANLDFEATEQKHTLGMEVAEAKAAQAKKPNGATA